METKRLVIPEAEEIIDSYFPVLDHGFISLKEYMGGDDTVEESARVSYGRGTRKVSDKRNLLRYLFRNKHTSPFEMVEFRFHIGLPIFVMRQLVRHRTANLNEYSGRYSVMPMMFYQPGREHVCKQSTLNKQGRAAELNDDEFIDWTNYQNGTLELAKDAYRSALQNDVARETARLHLPLSMYTFCYWKMDLRNLFNVMSLRSDPHAQWEIQAFSDVICGIVERVAPLSFEAFQDYQQGSVTFSQNELSFLPYAFRMKEGIVNQEDLEQEMAEEGMGKREIQEFWDKLRPKPKKNYSLDLSTARPGTYYEEMMEKYAA